MFDWFVVYTNLDTASCIGAYELISRASSNRCHITFNLEYGVGYGRGTGELCIDGLNAVSTHVVQCIYDSGRWERLFVGHVIIAESWKLRLSVRSLSGLTRFGRYIVTVDCNRSGVTGMRRRVM